MKESEEIKRYIDIIDCKISQGSVVEYVEHISGNGYSYVLENFEINETVCLNGNKKKYVSRYGINNREVEKNNLNPLKNI